MSKLGRYENLFIAVANRKPKTIIEVGTWNGEHAKQMLEIAKKYHPIEEITYYGFDLFEKFDMPDTEFCPKKPASIEDVRTKLVKTGCNIFLNQGNTKDTIPEFEPVKVEPVDFIFIDGGHSEETIQSDWDNLKKWVGPKTLVLFDDYYHNQPNVGCKFLIDELRQGNSGYLATMLPPIDTIKNTGLMVQMVSVIKSSH